MTTRTSTLDPRPSSRRGAFTLTELLVSMSIVAALLLVGVATYWRMSRGFALRAGVSSVEQAMRGAQAFAVQSRSPAVVVLEPVPENPFDLVQRIYALGKRTVGCWHFEQGQIDGAKLKGALGQEGDIAGLATSVPGKIGRAITFDGSTTAVSVTSPYLNEIRDGVFVDAYVWPNAEGMSSGAILPVVSKDGGEGSTFTLALRYQPTATQDLFSLEGSVDLGDATNQAQTQVLIRAREWTHVGLAYMHDAADGDGQPVGLILRINGQEVTLTGPSPTKGKLAPNTAPLLIGRHGSNYFRGRMDELKIGSLVVSDLFKLPQNTEVRADPGSSDGRVHFDDEGKLDTRYHGKVVRFIVRSPRDRLVRYIQVNWLGGVEVLDRQREDVE